MKKLLPKTKATIILLLITVLSLGFYTYMLARPISYGMGYYNKTVYEGMEFEGITTFHTDGTLTSSNTNFQEENTGYYYYRDGYVFILLAETKAEYDAEIAYINENFEEAIAAPFYASKINAFRHVAQDLDDASTYTCTGAIMVAIVGGVVELTLLAWTAVSFAHSKKATPTEE